MKELNFKVHQMLQKRLFCAQTATEINSKINLSKKWRIKQVTKSNFKDVLDDVKTHIFNSDFIAIYLQKTGSYSSPWQKVLPFDTFETAYFKAKYSAERFQVFQLAICPFIFSPSKLTAFPYNFHLFPRDELKIGMPSYSFACQTSYLTSMARLGFDFNACIYDGISYLSRAQESAKKHLTGNSLLRAHAVQSSPASSVADSLFIERIKSRVRTWRSACKDSGTWAQDPLIKSLRKIVIGEDHGSRPSMDIDVCSDRQVQLVLEVLKDFSDDIVPLLVPTKRGDVQGIRIVLTSSKEDKLLFERELQSVEEEQSKRVRGFREVIDLLSASQKPIVAHNSLEDFTFIHSKFLSPLPSSIDEFKCSLKSTFPYIVDLSHLIKEISPLRTMNSLPAASSFLRSRVFAPVDIEIPLEGKPDEMNEGKIYGHNVVRIIHLFAKLHSVLERHGSGGNSFVLQNYANIFGPCCDSPLENSDDDVKVSSGHMRRLSIDNLVFLWGFRKGSTISELQRLLRRSHEVFSGEFDVRLVDKSCAVVAFWQPGLSASFVDAMNSGGAGHEGLRELISDGLKVANYKIYKRVCEMGKWDSDLADSLEQVLSLNDSIPVSRGKSPYEIWWDDNTVVNLDDL